MLPPFPEKLSLANLPTEIRPLDRISEALGGPRIWVKCDDQSGCVLSGNKIRKLEYLIADAKTKACDTLLTCGGLQSNHCRATAAVAARLGMQCHLLLRGPESLISGRAHRPDEICGDGLEGNLMLDVLCGAKVSVYSRQHYLARLEQEFKALSESYARDGRRCYAIPTGGSNSLGLWGYISAAQELEQDFARLGIDPELIVCATGSGGTQGGLTLGFELIGGRRQILGIAVCDSSAYFENKIRMDVAQWQSQFLSSRPSIASEINISTNDQYIGPGYAIGYPQLFDAIRWVAAMEGVVLDPVYTGKAFYGMLQELKLGRYQHHADIVFVHTGGIYGLFPFKENFTSTP